MLIVSLLINEGDSLIWFKLLVYLMDTKALCGALFRYTLDVLI